MDTVSSSHIIRTCRQARHALRAARGASWLVQSFVALVFVFAVNGAYAQTFPGSVANTVRITLPSNTTDPTPGDTATDTNTLAVSDLSITKTLTSTSPALPGSTVTYQIVVTNAGPSPAQGATVTDTVPTELANVSWTCSAAGTSSCATAGGTGNISVAMDIGVGAANAATITVTGTAPLFGTIGANTATVVAPPGTDPVPGDNTDTVDPVPVSAVSDLTLVKTLTSASPAAAGSTVSYQIVVSNAGPSDAIGATITDTVPAQLGNVSWTCVGAGASSCGAPNGTGDVSLTANIAAGAGNTITITVTGTAPASGTIDANTATVTPPGGTTDPVPGDNTDTVDPVPVALVSDLSVVKTLTSASPAAAGSAVTYQVIVSNAGPSDAIGATITDTVPTQLGNVSWTCLAAGTSTCGTPNGIGDVSLTANIAAGAGNTITIVVTGTAPASGTIGANTATVTPPGGTTDPVPGDNTDTVDPVPVTPTVSINSASVAEGDSVVFTVSLSGPSATDVSVTLNTANGTAIAPGDYIAQSGLTVTILAGNTTATVSVPTIEDTLFEGDETFTATISNPVGATIGTATGTGTITDNDTQPAVSIDSASAAEGDAVVFTVSLSNPSTSDVTVTLNTADVTAIAGTDYTAQSGITVTIPAGATSVTVNVTTTEDTLFEGNETFTATISNPTG
ncbi:MAG TPA: Calx-beta domain-containing protein, partial [Lysobacter sp.]